MEFEEIINQHGLEKAIKSLFPKLEEVDLSSARYDEESIGRACIKKGIQVITTLSGAEAVVRAIRLNDREIKVKSIQEYHHH